MNEIISSEWRAAELPPPPSLYRWDQDDARYYGRVTPDGGVAWYPSVTTVIRDTSPMPPHLLKWYADKGLAEANVVRDEAAEYGTKFHIYASHLITGGSIDAEHFLAMPTRLQKDLAALITWAQKYNVRPLAAEMLLHSDTLHLAGTVDLVCELDHVEKAGDVTREVAVVDFKTSASLYTSHEIQANIYRMMWNEIYGDIEVGGRKLHATAAILWRPKDWRKAPTWEAKDVSDNVDVREIVSMCQLWGHRNMSFGPKSRGKFNLSQALTIASELTIYNEQPEDVILARHREVTR